jgi:hypothetical protein
MFINTEFTESDILEAINVVTDVVHDVIKQNNQFAASIVEIDPEAAEQTLIKTGEQIEAAQMLLEFALALGGDNEELSEYEV